MKLLSDAWEWISQSTTIKSALMAMGITIIRIAYDTKAQRWGRTALEAVLAGLLTVAAGSLLEWAGMPTEALLGIGGMIGWLGVNTLRNRLNHYLKLKVQP